MDQWKAKLEALKQQRANKAGPKPRVHATLPKEKTTSAEIGASSGSTGSSINRPRAPSVAALLKVMVAGKGVKRIAFGTNITVKEALDKIAETASLEGDYQTKYIVSKDGTQLNPDDVLSSLGIKTGDSLEVRLKGSSRVGSSLSASTSALRSKPSGSGVKLNASVGGSSLNKSTSGSSGIRRPQPKPKGGSGFSNDVGQLRRQLEEERRKREKLEEQLAGGSGATTSTTSTTGGGAAQELSLLKTEHRVLKMKFEAEARKLKDAERRLQLKQKELDGLKSKRGQAAKAVQSQAREMRMKRAEATIAARKRAPGNKPGARNSRLARQSVLHVKEKQNQVTNLLAKIVQEMARFEKKIKEAEDARMTAENEMIEVAMYKQQSDDQFSELVSDMKDLMTSQYYPILPMVDGPAKQKLLTFKTSVDYRLKQASGRAGDPDSDGPDAPPLPMSPDAPPLPSLLSSPGDVIKPNPRASTLLSQIRKGTSLKRLDIQAIKQERENSRRNHRQSMNILASLQSTLASALTQRHSDMNLDEEMEYEEDWEDEEGEDWE